jgi:hypothetical protein
MAEIIPTLAYLFACLRAKKDMKTLMRLLEG